MKKNIGSVVSVKKLNYSQSLDLTKHVNLGEHMNANRAKKKDIILGDMDTDTTLCVLY
jgi:hypothetical protein